MLKGKLIFEKSYRIMKLRKAGLCYEGFVNICSEEKKKAPNFRSFSMCFPTLRNIPAFVAHWREKITLPPCEGFDTLYCSLK